MISKQKKPRMTRKTYEARWENYKAGKDKFGSKLTKEWEKAGDYWDPIIQSENREDARKRGCSLMSLGVVLGIVTAIVIVLVGAIG